MPDEKPYISKASVHWGLDCAHKLQALSAWWLMNTSMLCVKKKKTDIKHGVALMGSLCPLGAQCCVYAALTFRKYFHEVLNFKRYNCSGGDNYLACTFHCYILCQH